MPDFFKANYGGIDLLVRTISTQVGRDVVVQSPARGDKHVNQDMGLRQKVAEVEILFCDQPGQADWMVRAKGFLEAADNNAPTTFTHQILGSYTARITAVEMTLETESAVRFRGRILPEDEPQITFKAGSGVAAGAGAAATNVAMTNATNALAAAGLSSSPAAAVPASCSASVAGWSAIDPSALDPQQVFLEVASATGQIDGAIAELELESDLALWPVYQTFILLRSAVVRSAEAATSAALNVFDLYIDSPRPLLAICADIYGPALAEERWADVMRLNRIRTPGLVPAGTTLKMPTDGAIV